jgi:preprotein translocase subunit SecE
MFKRVVVVVLLLAGFIYAADAIVEKMTGVGIFMRLGF